MTRKKAVKPKDPSERRVSVVLRFLRGVAQQGHRSAAWAEFYSITEQMQAAECSLVASLFALAASASVLPQACVMCGCTHDAPCSLPDSSGRLSFRSTSCGWACHFPPVCTSPPCVARAKREGFAMSKGPGDAIILTAPGRK